MKPFARGLLLAACAAMGISLAVLVCRAPQATPGAGRATASRRSLRPTSAERVTPAQHHESAHAHPAGATRTGHDVAASNSHRPLTPAPTNPAVAQQQALPEVSQIPGLNGNEGLIGLVEKVVETMNQTNQAQQQTIQKLTQELNGGSGALPSPTAAGGPAVGAGEEPEEPGSGEPAPAAAPRGTANQDPPQWDIKPVPNQADGEQRFYFNFPNMDIHEVLELLATQGNLNILPTRNVQGTVSVVLNDVTIEGALEAICKTNGLVIRRQGNFVYVGSQEDFTALNTSLERVVTRVFRPNYVAALDLQQLLTPLLTPTIGKISVTTAPQVGIASDGDEAGGNSLAQTDALVVQDYESAVMQMEQIVAEIDVKPLQVAIEAMILSVKLNDENQFGINWNFLLSNQHVRLATGNIPDTIASSNPTTGVDNSFAGNGFNNGTGAGNIFLPNGGLAFAFLDQNLGSFVTALETIGDTDVIASPRLMCLNKQRAEILIGAKLGYVSTTVTETSTAQTVEFLEVGAQLRLRPFIATDGTIRMEVHPELSTGAVRIAEGFTLPDKEVTQVTTNVMIRDGCTVVIGGLMREDLTVNTSQVPLLGSLPAVGFLFRQRTEKIERREILVLLTPHIAYDPELCAEGQKGACDFHRRQRSALDAGNPLGRDYLGRKYLRLAQVALHDGDVQKAAKLVDLAVRFDPTNRAAIALQNDIAAGRLDGEHNGSARMLIDPELIEQGVIVPDEGQGVIGPDAIDAEQIDPRVLEQLEVAPQTVPVHPRDPGQPGGALDIIPGPQAFEP